MFARFTLVLLTLITFSMQIRPATADNPNLPATANLESPSEFVEVILPADANAAGRSVVRWNDVAKSIAISLRLDDAAVATMLPRGEIDLDAEMVGLLLLGLNVAADGAVSVDRVLTAEGRLGLRVRCRRDFLPVGPKRDADRKCAIDLDDDWKRRTADKPLVVFIHGMHSDGDAFADLRKFVRRSDFATASVTYDFDDPIASSATKLSELVRSTLRTTDEKRTKLALVGHSMGGLAARQWTEKSDLPAANVQHLITIGTPHGGSNWASLPPMVDLFAGKGLDSQAVVDVLLHRPSSAGVRDLVPGSPFLRELNSRPRRGDVKYTAIIGSGSPVTAQDANALQDILQKLDRDGSFLRLIRPRIRPLLDSFDELVAGKGDGVVSCEHAKIPGCEDNVIVDVSHFDMISSASVGNPGAPTKEVWQTIADRLQGRR